jgi:methyl-accepting chemotaxis protein
MPELQFPVIILLIVLVSLEGGFVGWGFHRAVAIAQEWQRPHLIRDFFIIMVSTIVPIVVVNFLAGTYFSAKIAGPVEKIGNAFAEIASGNLDQEVSLRDGDFLQSFAESFNEMAEALHLRREKQRKELKEARAALKESLELVTGQKGIAESDRERLKALLSEIKAHLSAAEEDFVADLGDESHPF